MYVSIVTCVPLVVRLGGHTSHCSPSWRLQRLGEEVISTVPSYSQHCSLLLGHSHLAFGIEWGYVGMRLGGMIMIWEWSQMRGPGNDARKNDLGMMLGRMAWEWNGLGTRWYADCWPHCRQCNTRANHATKTDIRLHAYSSKCPPFGNS